MNPIQELINEGQSPWFDYIRKDLFTSGELKRLIEEDGIRGMTSNPLIFRNAISGSDLYDDSIKTILKESPEIDVKSLYEKLAIEDIQMAADTMQKLYFDTGGADGFISLEVSPLLAKDTKGTIEEARRLWNAVNRPNLMIKVPATPEGIPAIEQLISEGINLNVTLIFSLDHYISVAEAFLKGLAKAENPHQVASVASVFVSRVDTVIDQKLEKIGTPESLELKGKIALANAKLIYQKFKEFFKGDGFYELEEEGARPQRPLWASTGTKNPEYSPFIYVTALIGTDTVNTMPPKTFESFKKEGIVEPQLEENLEEAKKIIDCLPGFDINLDNITQKLQKDGVKIFANAFEDLLKTLEEKIKII